MKKHVLLMVGIVGLGFHSVHADYPAPKKNKNKSLLSKVQSGAVHSLEKTKNGCTYIFNQGKKSVSTVEHVYVIASLTLLAYMYYKSERVEVADMNRVAEQDFIAYYQKVPFIGYIPVSKDLVKIAKNVAETSAKNTEAVKAIAIQGINKTVEAASEGSEHVKKACAYLAKNVKELFPKTGNKVVEGAQELANAIDISAESAVSVAAEAIDSVKNC
ncbi:hypothetical protein K9K77_03225 [Candidatus Babeliales bacterium]|nr:hypothetical protein [Candidatus Babeliales bacterium]